MVFSLLELAKKLDAKLVGDPDCSIYKVATLQNAKPGCISFLANSRYQKYLATTKASAVILSPEALDLSPVPALVVAQPYVAFAKVAQLLHTVKIDNQGIHEQAVVHPSCRVDESAWIGPNVVLEQNVVIGANAVINSGCVVGENTMIGDNTQLMANVTIAHSCVIGKNVTIHSGTVVGSDGFGIAWDKDHWLKVPQIGRVIIKDEVEIGANTAIDRGALDDTIIEKGAKIDNLVQIAHNCVIGEHTAIAGCAGIAGSSKIGAYCTIAGGVGIVGHIQIADKVHITGMSLVSKSITKSGSYSSGTTLQPTMAWKKSCVRFKQLDDMAKQLKSLTKL